MSPQTAAVPPTSRSAAAVVEAVASLTGRAPSLRGGGLAGVRPDGGTLLRAPTVSTGSISPGDLFVALAGTRAHGARFAADAVAAGARAVLTDEAGASLLGSLPPDVLVLVSDVADLRAVVGPLAAWWYGDPVAQTASFAVTGTNGKTTTTYVLDALGRLLGRRTGIVGTIEVRSGDRVVPSVLTTPEATDLQRFFAEMRADGVTMTAMEVSSHALALHRVDGVRFDVAGFTNLTQDHLDFHGDLESYFAAKALLFTPEHARRAVVCVDDAWGARLAREATVPVASLATRAPEPGVEVRPDWEVREVVPGAGVSGAAGATSFVVAHRDGRRVPVRSVLPGGFNVSNVALAVVMLVESGVEATALADVLAAAGPLDPRVPGRMELVGEEPRTVVDFAHNPDALSLALRALRPTTRGRLVVVFGATGERDRSKRPIMGRVAAELADVVVVTDDDPHGEPAGPVRSAVLEGARAVVRAVTPDIREISPRERAIRETIAAAGADDTVLVAGRGHETTQDVAGVDRPLDDRVEARAALASRAARAAGHRAPEPARPTDGSWEGPR